MVAGVAVVAVVGDTTLVEGMTVVGTDVVEPIDGAGVVVGVLAVDEHAPSLTTPATAMDAIDALTVVGAQGARQRLAGLPDRLGLLGEGQGDGGAVFGLGLPMVGVVQSMFGTQSAHPPQPFCDAAAGAFDRPGMGRGHELTLGAQDRGHLGN